MNRITQGDESHIGLGALQGALIVGVTLVGYDPMAANIAKLVSLAREEEAVAKSGPRADRSPLILAVQKASGPTLVFPATSGELRGAICLRNWRNGRSTVRNRITAAA